MEKKNNFSEDTPETDKVSEPAISYERKVALPSYSIEELRERADRAIQEIEKGKIISQEDMRKRHPL